MKKGFVFGKYLPFHFGHKSLIDFALTKCDLLYVFVCCSNKEKISSQIRANWIEKTFSDIKKLNVIEFNYEEELLPNTSNSSKEVSKLWAKEFTSILPDVDLVFTSEDYGDFLAEFMGIKHIPFDKDRIKNPISSSKIRESVYKHWSFLPKAVKIDYQKKVVFLGTESTGKSSLSKSISEKFNSTLVKEIGREIIPNSASFSEADLKKIATEHAKNIKNAHEELKPIVFIDTDIHITQSYSKFQFGRYLEIESEIYEINKSDLYFYLNKDLTFTQDGTRLDESNRNKLDLFHRNTLKDFNIDYIEIDGTWQNRFEKIFAEIEKCFTQQ